MAHYLEEAAAAHQARGLSREQALRAARMELGGVTQAEEQVRSYGWENAVDALAADLRFAARRLRAAPGFTAVAVLTLALGIGATTAIFSAVNPILFRPLPYPDPGRITMVWDFASDFGRLEPTFGTYSEISERSRSYAALSVQRVWLPTAQGTAEPERLDGQRVTRDYFRVLGVGPSLGRGFLPTEDRLGGAKVVVLSDGLWRRRFGADSAILGRQVELDGDGYTVVGVMPRGFEDLLAPSAEVYTTLQYDMSLDQAWGHHLRMAGRLRPGVSVEDADRELDAIAREPVAAFARPEWAALTNGLSPVGLQDDITRGVRPALLGVLAAACVVLMLACVNVTNLLLARGVQRRGEFALRAALGAGHRRLVRQLLTESLVLAALGGAVGIAVAFLGVRALVALSPPGLPRADAIAVDGAVFGFGLALTTLIGLVFGLMPALQASRSDPAHGLQQASPRGGGGHGHRRVRAALVVAEVGLALVLLVSSGLLLRSLQRLFAVSSGVDPSNLLTMQVQTAGHRFDDDSTTHRFFSQSLEAVRSIPGVTAAALTSQLPMSGEEDLYGVHFTPAVAGDPGNEKGAYRYAVSPGYIETMGIPLKRGRVFDQRDRAGAPMVALISESMARRRLPGLDPIGLQVIVGSQGPYAIVGVVGDVRQVSLALTESEAVYIPAQQWGFTDRALSLVVRTRAEPMAAAPAIRRAIWSVDRDQPIVRLATMDELVAASAAERRFALILFQAFAITALVLAGAGIYGVLSGSVAERTREIGVRAALGASRAEIVGLVLRQGMTLTGLGVVIGVAGAMAATRGLVAMLFGISPLDPVTYLGMITLLAGVAVAACGVPAWRAARVDPASTLRADSAPW